MRSSFPVFPEQKSSWGQVDSDPQDNTFVRDKDVPRLSRYEDIFRRELNCCFYGSIYSFSKVIHKPYGYYDF